MQKRWVAFAVGLLCAMLAATALAVTAPTSGPLVPVTAYPNQRVSMRSGPGTNYTEIFTLPPEAMHNFTVYQQEKGGTVMWAMIEFDSNYGMYRVYTGMKRVDTATRVPVYQPDGVPCKVGNADTWAYYGPSKQYVRLDDKVPAGLELTIHHEENGYVMADFVMPDAKEYKAGKQQVTRAWIPVEALADYQPSTQSNER